MLIALLGALLIGLTLGLLGSGGSILTVPVLVYLVGEPEKVAIAESLGIVALISLFAALPYAWERKIHWRSVLLFGLPGMAGTYAGAYLSQYMPGAVQLILFAVVMLLAAAMMLRRPSSPPGGLPGGDGLALPEAAGVLAQLTPVPVEAGAAPAGGARPVAAPVEAAPAPIPEETPYRRAGWKIFLEGSGVGVMTGLVGVGGGFLIVPALVLFGRLSMRMAVGTSLLIIAMKSFSGLYKYREVLQEAGLALNGPLILFFGAVGIVGSLIGNRAGAYIPQAKLKRGFAVFLVLMGAFILWQYLPPLLG